MTLYYNTQPLTISEKMLFGELKVLTSKMTTVIEVFPYIVAFDKNDLFSLDEEH
jgi:hypothetical protein